ncbi:MAG TPA: DUF2027 domain-containing protein [Paludibacteraceae bacterium]|nr:DUF2027 domain-containing protein [Paludibacteraceae bacterium]
MIKKGDTVRFLNAVGGGKVTRIDEKQNIVYVEDADGFEVPALARECVVIEAVNQKTNFPVKDFKSKPVENTMKPTNDVKSPEQSKTPEPIVETPDGELFKSLLAFFATDIKRMETTAYECYLVNDSNYFLYYNFVNGEESNRKSIANGTIEPNMQEFLCNIEKTQLNEWEKVRVQIIPFKKDKIYTEQDALDFMLKINTVKFYKLHSFTETDYFDDPCMLIDLTEERNHSRLREVSPEEIRQVIHQKSQPPLRPRILNKLPQKEIIEVDLHINTLLDSTAGMTNAEMLSYQMDTFHRILEENKNKKGQKIVFIHGKGEGVLRTEIEKQLKSRYKGYLFQDASFREYGFGATMVIIR